MPCNNNNKRKGGKEIKEKEKKQRDSIVGNRKKTNITFPSIRNEPVGAYQSAREFGQLCELDDMGRPDGRTANRFADVTSRQGETGPVIW